MHCKRAVVITDTLTPHDVALLVLVTLFCANTEHIGHQTLLKLIPSPNGPVRALAPFNRLESVIEAAEVVPPLLGDLVQLLEDHGCAPAALRMVTTLERVATVGAVDKLISTLHTHCIRDNYRAVAAARAGRVLDRQLTRSSLLGRYVCQCVSKHKLQDFEDSEKLWRNLQRYLQQFKRECAEWKGFHCQRPPLDPLMRFILESDADLQGLQELRNAGLSDRYSDLTSDDRDVRMMISHDHLQALLAHETHLMLYNNSPLQKRTRMLIDCMSLEDTARFPVVYVLKGLEDLRQNRYDTFLSLLYRYFDYMLGQNTEPNFYLSLLSLASFHAHFHNSDAAVKTFEEAIAVARENKDTHTLNLILMWVFEFMCKYPNLAPKFHVSTAQILQYLKTCPQDHSSYVFEMGYRYDTLWTMQNTGDVVQILESTFKSSLLALQRVNGTRMMAAHNSKIWEYLGSKALQEVYEDVGVREMVQQNLPIPELLTQLKAPDLTYFEKRMFEKQIIDQWISLAEYDQAMQFVNCRIHECQSELADVENEHRFQLAKCQILVQCHLHVRTLPILSKVIEHASTTKNNSLLGPSVLLLSEVLLALDKRQKCFELLSSVMHKILAYADANLQLATAKLYLASKQAL
ncbi:LAME_0F12068g1_1 [Lachancea meyersii CBS 8951]|uniref:Anaphase-promoting complex subunit 5 n=1 Tax=Lachancea meyersii CBS 8951 TaxID=1266667 RepID=A0A1G4JWG8_9SACH|nr:LAME_0F12068g1_1 [Lachancea meyersii CBS 8951]